MRQLFLQYLDPITNQQVYQTHNSDVSRQLSLAINAAAKLGFKLANVLYRIISIVQSPLLHFSKETNAPSTRRMFIRFPWAGSTHDRPFECAFMYWWVRIWFNSQFHGEFGRLSGGAFFIKNEYNQLESECMIANRHNYGGSNAKLELKCC